MLNFRATIFICALTLSGMSPQARGATLYVSSVRAAPGDSLRPVRIAIDNSIALAGAEFILEFDPTHISLDSIAKTAALAGQSGSGANQFQPGKVAFLVFDLQGALLPPSDSVDLFDLWFSASAQAPIPLAIPISITAASFVDEQLDYDSAFAGNGTMTICVCPCHADPLPVVVCDGVPNILDVVGIIDVAFRGEPDPFSVGCSVSNTDVDCDGSTDIFDVIHMINVAFRGNDPATEFCNPCGP